MKKKKIILIVGIILFVVALGTISTVYYHGLTSNKEELEEEATDVGIIKVNDKNFDNEVLKSDKPVILEFTSNLCLPCISMLPTLINIAKNNEDIKVATTNTSDENSTTIIKKYEINATPTIIVFKDGKILNTYTGATNEETLMKGLK